MAVVGGLGTVRGPIIGAFVVTMLSELLRDTVVWRLVVQGALLLIVLAFWPAGRHGLLERGLQRVRTWMNVAQEEGEREVRAAATGAAPAAPADSATPIAAPADSAVQQSEKPATVGVAGGPRKPEKKVGRFKAWLNADQPQADGHNASGSRGGKKTWRPRGVAGPAPAGPASRAGSRPRAR